MPSRSANPRVVSLLPSATELLATIGAADLLVGRSHECDHPDTVLDRPVLTAQRTTATTSAEIDRQVRTTLADENAGAASLYTLDTDLLASLRPDVILTQDLCSVCSIDLDTVRRIASDLSPSPEVISLNPTRIEDVFDDVLTIGEAIGRTADAERAMVHLRGRYWSAIDYVNGYIEGPEVAVIEWMDPLFIAGHWTPDMIRSAGGRCSLITGGEPSRQIAPEDLLEVAPERVIISPCGYDLASIRRELTSLTEQRWWPLLPAVMDGHVAIVDGSRMFSRPGPRLVDAFCFLVAWMNDRPEVMPADVDTWATMSM